MNEDDILNLPEKVAGSIIVGIAESPIAAAVREGDFSHSGHSRAFSMANPSLKNGYISVANELVEQLAKISIPASEMRIVWVVWRKTWGWKQGDRKKDWDWISLSQFELATTMKHGNVAKAVKSLVVKRILLKREKGVKFNQNYEEWVVCKRLPPVVKRIPGSSQTHTKISSQTHTNKRKKETLTKDIESLRDSEMIVKVIDSFLEVNSSSKNWYVHKTHRAAIARLLKEHGLEQILKVVSLLPRTNSQSFFPSINNPSQLEEKWSQLENALKRKKQELSSKKPIFL